MKSSQAISEMDQLLRKLISFRKQLREGLSVEDPEHLLKLENRALLIRDFGNLYQRLWENSFCKC